MPGRYIVQLYRGRAIDSEFTGRYIAIEEARDMAKQLIAFRSDEGVVIVNEDAPHTILEVVAHGHAWSD